MSIRRLVFPQDTDSFVNFFQSLNHDTLMRYGRFNEEERDRELLKIQTDKNEIGFGAFFFDHVTEGGEEPPLVGYLHFNLSDKFSRKGYQASLGIVIHPHNQNKGIGTELMRYGLEEMRKRGFRKIWLHVWEDNTPARKLYARSGFKTEGVFERDQMIDGEAKNVVSMALFLD